MILWRIAADTRLYSADDMTGAGAAKSPGRWNKETEPIIYSTLTVALAMLETAAYVDSLGIPLNRYLIEINVPDSVWTQHEKLDVTKLPPTWSAVPAGHASVTAGSSWLSSKRSPILIVPSAIVPEEQVSLINPLHPESCKIKARVSRSVEYNRIFRRRSI